mgnify:CR=1 FL=1
MKFDKLLKNKYLHYAAVALMVINVLGYVAMGSIECILVLGGAAYLAQHFTKNRTADIFIGLFVANILFGCGRLREGAVGAMEDADAAIGKAKAKVDQAKKEKTAEAVTCGPGQEMKAGKCVQQAAASDIASKHLAAAGDAMKAAAK